MEDRYLFRAKRIDNGEWVVGDLSHHKTGRVFVKPLNGSAISTCEEAFYPQNSNPQINNKFCGFE